MQDIDGCACLTLLSLETSTTTRCRLNDLCSLGNVDTGRRQHKRPVPPVPNPPGPRPHVGVIIIDDNGWQQQGFQFKGQPSSLSSSSFQNTGFPSFSVDLISLRFGACTSLIVADCCLPLPPVISAGCHKGLGKDGVTVDDAVVGGCSMASTKIVCVLRHVKNLQTKS